MENKAERKIRRQQERELLDEYHKMVTEQVGQIRNSNPFRSTLCSRSNGRHFQFKFDEGD